MGVVYRAEDTRLGRTVALKVLPDDLALSQEHVRRFEREARTASAITHPGIATLYDFDREGDVRFFTMEFVEGKTLRQILSDSPLPHGELLECACQVAEALSAAHQKGIVHRDLKPENVMAADSGFYKILDFGLARMELREEMGSSSPTQWATVSRQVTGEGKIVGTFAYMSPEQVQGHDLDARSDIFSFGVLLYEMVTGKLPFRGNNAIAVFHAIVHQDPEPMALQRDDVPLELERIAAKCLAKNVKDRYQTAADLAVDLRALRRDSESGARYYSSPAHAVPARRAPRRGRVVLWSVLAVALAAVLALTLWVGRQDAAPARPEGRAPFPAAVDAGATRHNRIALATFSNLSGDPRADWLRQALPEMLTTDLAQSDDLEVISTQRMNDLAAAAGRGGDDLDQATATELARWAGAGVVVSGSIFKAGDGYRIDVQASDTLTGKVISANRAEGTDLFGMADRLAEDLRQGLQVTAGGERDIEQVTTSSPEAFRHFTAGMESYRSLHLDEARAAFRRSLEADAEFPLAQLRLGLSLYLDGDREEGLEWIERARAQAGRLPERERLLATGIHAGLLGREKGGHGEQLAELAAKFPRDVEALFWKAQVESAREGDPSRAIRTLQEAMERDPESSLAVAGLVAQLRGLQLGAEADAILKDFLARHPEVSTEQVEEFCAPPAPGS
jgi:TolB-like protein